MTKLEFIEELKGLIDKADKTLSVEEVNKILKSFIAE